MAVLTRMDHPVRFVMAWLATYVVTAAAEPAKPETAETRERSVSSRVAGLLAAAAPKYETVPPADPVGANPATREGLLTSDSATPANTIVRLPPYLVRERREPKLPEREEVIGRERLEKIAMQRYLGDETGLERALSTLTPVHLWRLIPILGKYPFVTFQTNEQRAMAIYEKERERERWENLTSLLSPSLSPEKPKPSPEK